MKRKCPSCAKKIEREFNYCPWCGAGIKNVKNRNDYGLIGNNDNVDANLLSQEIKLPTGIEKLANSLINQLNKEMKELGDDIPHKFNIKIQTGIPINNLKKNPQEESKEVFNISSQEKERRKNLPKKIAKSKVKRFSDSIIYEIEVDEIKDKTQVNVVRLEDGFEIRIFGKSYCFVKNIPLNMKLIGYKFSKDKVMVEFKE